MITIILKDKTWPTERWQKLKESLEERGATVHFNGKPQGDSVKVTNALVSYDRATVKLKPGARRDYNEADYEQQLRAICRTYGAVP